MTKDEALKLAREALQNPWKAGPDGVADAITAIKESLAQPEPWEKFCDSNCVWTDHHPDCKLAENKPVFWYKPYPNGMYNGPIHNAQIGDVLRGSEEWIPLYTAPQRKPLSDEQIILIVAECASSHQHTDIHFARAIEQAHGIKGEQ